ncbi:hypothetical protein CTAYLR_002066 [Chrysophaeum taylorii]|uniref:histidine kinase n=1 Tax=Chrysophaeum taylorii TaxID=2483200 RepID=A0AAD7UN94_9STRA|nr:hypothetical protein CTAYLR_002066 [Chrysophaeum taylorii]
MVVQIREDSLVKELKDRLADLDRNFSQQFGSAEFRQRVASLIRDLSNGIVSSTIPKDKKEVLMETFDGDSSRTAKSWVASPPGGADEKEVAALMETFEVEYRRAKSRVASLRATLGDFRDFREAYFEVAKRRVVRISSEKSGTAVRAYQAAAYKFRNVIDDVSERKKVLLRALSMVSLAAATAAFVVLTRAWILSSRETTENEARLVTKNVELDIQRRILSQVLHEMRNKYSAAAHMLEHVRHLARSSKNTDAVRDELARCDGDITKSLALLHEADALIATRLTLHRLYAGTYASEPNVRTVDLGLLLRGRVDAAEPFANTGVAFEAIVPKDLEADVSVRLDVFIFGHIANNLLSNARKHTVRGKISLRFVCRASADDDETRRHDGLLVFAVADTGRGVPESVAERLFFEEVSTGDARGAGLGLVSCKNFAASVGGNIWLHSTKSCAPDDPASGGTEFRFALPGELLLLPSRTPRDSAVRTAATVGSLPESIRAVIVEDSGLIRSGLKMKLRRVAKSINTDFNVVEHETVESLLAAANPTFFAEPNLLVLVDENLCAAGGILRGRDLIAYLKAQDFKGVVISASGDDESVAVHRELGADIIWTKPFGNVGAMARDILAAFESQRRRPTRDESNYDAIDRSNDSNFSVACRRPPPPSTRAR